jgi:hypothetical protein
MIVIDPPFANAVESGVREPSYVLLIGVLAVLAGAIRHGLRVLHPGVAPSMREARIMRNHVGGNSVGDGRKETVSFTSASSRCDDIRP